MENLQSLPEIQRLIAIGKANSEVSYDEINDILPDKILNSEKIDDVFTLLHEMGIDVVEEYSKKFEEPQILPGKDEKPIKKKKEGVSISATSEDPIRLYLKEIGKVSLISGETEVFLAKRIEKGEKIIEETILGSSILRANFSKLMPKIRSKKIKIYEIVRVEKSYAMSPVEMEKLEKLFFQNMDKIQSEEKTLIECQNKIKKYSENSRKHKEFKDKIDEAQKDIDSAVREVGVSQREIQKISQKIKSMVFRIKEIDRHFLKIKARYGHDVKEIKTFNRFIEKNENLEEIEKMMGKTESP